MPRVILQISYEIKPDKREEYLALARELKNHFVVEQKKQYSLYEQKGKKNYFVEQFVCDSMEEFEALEDNMTENSEKLIDRLETLLKDGKAKYSTLIGTE
jgi:antibiotic biosynthesis monooxygenase (ABM) superfamily enzyme